MQITKLGFASVTGILVGILGVVGPIVWDYYKTKSEIELRVIGKSVIISKPEKMDGLIITYDGEALDELSKTAFSVINSGRTPILKKDIVSPISVKFAKESNIINAKLDGMQPQDLGASLRFNRGDGTIVFEFPLMNPGDRVDFSVLSKTGNVKFDAVGRIAGVSSLTVVKDIPQDKVGKSLPWTVYPVGFFSALLAFASIMGFRQVPTEMRIKTQIKTGTFELPRLKAKEEWMAWINSTFYFTTVNERAPLLLLISELPDADDFATIHREKIMAGIQSLLRSALSNLVMGLIVLAIATAGGWYVFSNL